MKAIETQYKGYRFRSRLEARWAVFFDALDIDWKYEPEGFEKEVGYDDEPKKTVRYLPDFYLPKSGTWVEVKGVMTASDASVMADILDYGSPLWLFDESAINFNYKQMAEHGLNRDCRGILILGDIPKVTWGYAFHPIIRHNKGLQKDFVVFSQRGPEVASPDKSRFAQAVAGHTSVFDYLDALTVSDRELVDFFSNQHFQVDAVLANKKVMTAYQAARSARFEHGEKGYNHAFA